MAQLTNNQKQTMLNTPSFLTRVRAALIDYAHYINNLPAPNVEDYNKRMQLRKRKAIEILNGGVPTISLYAEHFLKNYIADPALIITDPEDPHFGQLTDAALFSAYQEVPFDFFAQTKLADADEPITW